MATFATKNTWYKGSFPWHQITEINIRNSQIGVADEAWDASATLDGSITCYRKGTVVDIVFGDDLTAIGDRMFTKALSLEKVTGLDSVVRIDARAFSLTPNLKSVDFNPANLTSIGESAFWMSSIEDYMDLSSVSGVAGDRATRQKRWSADSLKSLRSVTLPLSVRLSVPNMDSQKKEEYAEIPYCKDSSVTEGVGYVGGYACEAFANYHAWNYFHANTDKQYDNWLDWYNATINVDGDFAEKNDLGGITTIEDYSNSLTEPLGWKYYRTTNVDGLEQLKYILHRLNNRLPVLVSIHSYNNVNGKHAVLITGYNAETHKLAVVDSAATQTEGVEYWLSFEDMFAEGELKTDKLYIIEYNPVLAPSNTWFTNTKGVTTTNITEIHIKDTYTSDTATSWDASAKKDGSIMVYVEGSKLTIAGNGTGRISMNPDSSQLFNGFKQVEVFNGADILLADNVTTLEKAFYDCQKIKLLNLNGWYTGNLTSLRSTFNGMMALETIAVDRWNTESVESIRGTFQLCTTLIELDLSGWKTSKVTTMYNAFSGIANTPQNLQRIIGIESWDVSNVTEIDYMFCRCPQLESFNISKWRCSPTSAKQMFYENSNISELDLGGFDTTKCSDMTDIFYGLTSLEKITLGENFRFNGNGSTSSVLPTPTDGQWYDINGVVYFPSEIPNDNRAVRTYYASKSVANADADRLVFIKNGTLQRIATALRTKSGKGNDMLPSEFADEVLALE